MVDKHNKEVLRLSQIEQLLSILGLFKLVGDAKTKMLLLESEIAKKRFIDEVRLF